MFLWHLFYDIFPFQPERPLNNSIPYNLNFDITNEHSEQFFLFSERYTSKERRRRHHEELASVKLLDIWEPAVPLGVPFGSEESRKYITA